MRDGKKHRGMKDEVRAYKKRLQYIATVFAVTVFVAIIAISSFLIYFYLNPSPNQTLTQPSSEPFSLKAAIVDHLSLTAPNQTFIQTATTILETANYTVDYYPGEDVNVEFYRNLPTHDYSLIILKVHSALRDPKGRPLILFTSQPYSKRKYVSEQLTDRIIPVTYTTEEAKKGNFYFGILPKFVQQDMKGKFHNTTIIMTGCNGLTYTYMAQAFIEKGAKVYIGWSLAVSAGYTDQATTHLLQHLIIEKETIKKAVSETMKEVGPDPQYGSILLYYPNSVDNYVIPNSANNLTMNAVQMNTAFYVNRRINGFVKDSNEYRG